MIFVTGGAGFIGSNFVLDWLAAGSESVVNVDKLTYAGNRQNLDTLKGEARHLFVQSDIGDSALIERLLAEHRPRAIINFAAESHVDRSISNPTEFVFTNVIGTVNLLNAARHIWNNNTEGKRFYHISTDEVYGSLGNEGMFTEETAYDPHSPYSASKASSDMIVRAYHHTYGMNTVVTNCSNNYGPKQHDEKLIPTIVRKALAGQKIPIYGDGKNIRDWLYVLDHCKGIDLAYHEGISGETYNIGGRNERNNLYIAHKICEILDTLKPKATSYQEQITFVEDRAGHDRRYAIDATKLENELGWKADENFDSGIIKTIEWYLRKYN